LKTNWTRIGTRLLISGNLLTAAVLMAQTPALNLPATATGVQAQTNSPTTYSLITSGIPAGLSLINTKYGAWCTSPAGFVPGQIVNYATNPPSLFDPSGVATYNVFSSYATNLPIDGNAGESGTVYGGTTVLTQAQEMQVVNYILNNLTGTNGNIPATPNDIQGAIWQLLRPNDGVAYVNSPPTTDANALALYNDAIAHGVGFIPGLGQVAAVVLDPQTPGNSPEPYQGVIVPVPLPAACVIPPSGTAIGGSPVSWNKFTPKGANNVVWIHAHIGKPNGVPTSTTTTVQFTGVTFVLNGQTYQLPNGVLIFNPATGSVPTTVFNPSAGANGTWTTTLNPNYLSDEIFFDGNAVPVDANISGGGGATFNYTTTSNDSNLSFSWQWSAAVYTYWPGNSQAQILPYHQSDHAGTPENKQVQQSLIQGPRGGGGSNYTGSWSGTGQGTCPGH
jgi:hypothetical protein